MKCSKCSVMMDIFPGGAECPNCGYEQKLNNYKKFKQVSKMDKEEVCRKLKGVAKMLKLEYDETKRETINAIYGVVSKLHNDLVDEVRK